MLVLLYRDFYTNLLLYVAKITSCNIKFSKMYKATSLTYLHDNIYAKKLRTIKNIKT